MTIEYHPEVERELRGARDFYEKQSPGLGAQFIDEFERQVLRIAATPERWMKIKSDIRRALMRRFPYVIYYRQPAPDRIRITVVKHQRRHPAYGLDRE
ncbi:MAG TPA: type II toxin-antitoxin system RelE/ParE family toxin [Clostridia bacterium]|nr:type II toxin-antitoxin system RelE/ParE family toxin [Clostridia bacterium]